MKTRGLKTLFAGGASSILPLMTLQATLYLVGPILGYDINDTEDFLETMTLIVNTGMIGGSLVAVIYIHKSSSAYYFIMFTAALICHSHVFLTTHQDDAFLWLTIGMTMGTFSTICQYKVILRAAIYENKDYVLGLIPFALSGITFGKIIGVGIQYFVLKRFPLSNTVNEKMFLIYIWFFTIIAMIFSYSFYSDIGIEIDYGGDEMNKDIPISMFTDYDSYRRGFHSFRLILNPLSLYLLCCAMDSFFIPGSVNIITDSFHHIKFPWNRYSLLFSYYTGLFCGTSYAHLKSRIINQGIRPIKIHEHISLGWLWFMLLCIRLPTGILYMIAAHYRYRTHTNEEIILILSIVSTLINGITTGIITSYTLISIYFDVKDSDMVKGAITINKARVALSFSMYIAGYVIFFMSWIGRKYLALFAHVVRHSGNGIIWPTHNLADTWTKIRWWIRGTLMFMRFDLHFIYNVFMSAVREIIDPYL